MSHLPHIFPGMHSGGGICVVLLNPVVESKKKVLAKERSGGNKFGYASCPPGKPRLPLLCAAFAQMSALGF